MEFLGTLFSFKKWCFFIHGETMVLDLILCCKMHNYRKVILLNLKMFLCAWWPFFCCHKRHSIIQNYFKSLVFSKEQSSSEIWNCQWHKTFSVTPVFTVLISWLIFQIIKIRQCCGFTFTNFLFFLTATNALATSWATFSNTVFCIFWFDFPMVARWK